MNEPEHPWIIIQDNHDCDGPWVHGPFPTQALAYGHAKRHALAWLETSNQEAQKRPHPDTFKLTDDDPDYINIESNCEENHTWWHIEQLIKPKY